MNQGIVRFRSNRFQCLQCEKTQEQSIVEWHGKRHVGDAENWRAWANDLGFPTEDELEIVRGLCARCYQRQSDDDARLVRQLEVYARNIKHIEEERFHQPGAQEKHLRYQALIRQAVLEWQARTVFLPVPLPNEGGTFYMEEFITAGGLEERLEWEL